MNDMSMLLLGLVLAGGVFLLYHLFFAWFYSGPHDFDCDGERFRWVPAERNLGRLATRHFFGRHYRHGRFEHGDGRPVTDIELVRKLPQRWEWKCRPPG